jgi:hypothetical protein
VLAALDGADAPRWLEADEIEALLVSYGIAVGRGEDGGLDVLVGAVNHRQLGVVAGIGAGGPQAGLFGDVAFRLAPTTDLDADELVAAAPVVSAGLADVPELDREALVEVVLRLTRLFEDVPELIEGDLNPIRVGRGGVSVAGARLRAERRVAPDRIRTW